MLLWQKIFIGYLIAINIVTFIVFAADKIKAVRGGWRVREAVLLKELGVEGEYEGIGHCAIGYPDCDWPAVIDRKEGRAFWVE